MAKSNYNNRDSASAPMQFVSGMGNLLGTALNSVGSFFNWGICNLIELLPENMQKPVANGYQQAKEGVQWAFGKLGEVAQSAFNGASNAVASLTGSGDKATSSPVADTTTQSSNIIGIEPVAPAPVPDVRTASNTPGIGSSAS